MVVLLISGLWTSTPGMPNLRRNVASGPVAAHVFDTPGTYTVCVTAFDGANSERTSIQITVTDPNTVFAANTLCVGASWMIIGTWNRVAMSAIRNINGESAGRSTSGQQFLPCSKCP